MKPSEETLPSCGVTAHHSAMCPTVEPHSDARASPSPSGLHGVPHAVPSILPFRPAAREF